MHQEALKHYKNIMREHKDHWSMARENGSPIQDRIRECNRRLR